MENMIFIVLSSLETVHDTVQYRYYIFSLLYLLLSIRPNLRIPYFHTYDRERKYIVNVQFCAQYTLFNVGNVLLCVIYSLIFTVFM